MSINIGSYHSIPKVDFNLNFTEPEIIALCEHHSKIKHRFANSHFIMENYQEGDAVLVETPEYKSYWSDQIKPLPIILPLYGWDSAESIKQIKEVNNKIGDLVDKIHALRDKIFNVTFFDSLKMSDYLNNANSILDSIPAPYKSEQMRLLLNDEKLMVKYKEIIPLTLLILVSGYARREWKKFTQLDLIRNQSLVDRLESMRKKYRRVIVIAGEGHFLGEFESAIFARKYLSSKKSVILQPALSNRNIKSIKDDLKKVDTICNSIKWIFRYIRFNYSNLLSYLKTKLHSLINPVVKSDRGISTYFDILNNIKIGVDPTVV